MSRQRKKSLKRQIKGLGALIEVSGVDIANQIRLVELLGKDAVDLYKDFNKGFAEKVAKDVRSRIPVDTGALAGSVRATRTKQGASFRVGYNKKVRYARLVEFGGYNPYSRVGGRVRRLYKPIRPEGYFIFPSVRKRLPEIQRDYVKQLNGLIKNLYGFYADTEKK